MRKFLLASCLSLFCVVAMAAEDSQNSPLLAGLKAFRGPMTQMAAEAGRGRQANFDVVDKAIVEVTFKTARYIEHSPLLRNLETALAKKNMKSLAGALYLIRF